MHCRRVLTLFLLLTALSLCAKSLFAKTVTLGPADNHTTIALNLGDTLVVALQSAELPDYRWQAHLTTSSPLTALNDNYAPPSDPRSMGTYTFRFNAARVGQTILTLGFDKQIKSGPAPQNGIQTTSTFSVNVSIASGEPDNKTGSASGYTGKDILIALYKGMLPCADCSGLDTELRLYAKGKFDTTDTFFLRTRTYLATRDGNRTYTDRGEWFVLKGDAVNPDATVYQFIVDKPEQSEYLLLQGNTLKPLDNQLKPIELPADSRINLTLHRVR